MKFFVTYGVGSPKAGKYSVIDADNEQVARGAVSGACGRDYAFIYQISDLERQVREWGLKEVPLGPAKAE